MLSFLHTPPSSPADVKTTKPSTSPEYIPIKRENWTVSSPESETELQRKRRFEGGEEEKPNLKLLKTETVIDAGGTTTREIEEAKYMECTRLFDNPEDVFQAISLLRTRKNVNIKEYSHEGTFIPNVLLALSQTPRLSVKAPLSKPSPKLNKPRTECSRPYVCEYCGKQFTNIGNLATHARTHTKEKPYKCDKCDLMFAHTSNLQRHQLVHSGQRNNKCPHCAKSFSRSDYLKVHERTHTGEKPYACSVAGCTKRFLDSSSLKKHERTHTGDRPFACHICYKTYTESSKLKIHLHTHAQNFSRPVCSKKPLHQLKEKENHSYPVISTQTIPNPLYPSALHPSPSALHSSQLHAYSYERLAPYSMAPLPKPTPTRPTPTRVFYHPYSRAVLSAPTRTPHSIIDPARYSAFLPV